MRTRFIPSAQRRLQPEGAHLVSRTVKRVLIAAGLSLTATAALSQELQEVVVTAQKREQNIQNVPIAITAFTSETLSSKGISDVNQLGNLTPNVNLDSSAPFSGDSSVLSASIRGIGQDDFAFNLDPGVGVYLDGVYLARTIGANQNLMDVERIEILKGPQGTLFGRNTIGGAINIVTHTPGTVPRLKAQASGGSFNRRDLAFTADIPFSDNVLTTLSIASNVRDGYQKVIPYPAGSLLASTPFFTDPIDSYPKAGYDSSGTKGGQDQKVIRGKMLWHASESVDFTFSADWTHQNQSSTPTTVLSVSTSDPNKNIFGYLYNYCISNPATVLNSGDPNVNPAVASFGPFVTSTTTGACGPRAAGTGLAPGAPALGGAGYVSGPGGNLLLSGQPHIYWNKANTDTGDIDKTYSNGISFAKSDSYGGSILGEWNIQDNLLFRSISGYRQIKWNVGVDLDGLPEQIQEVSDSQHQNQFSQEFQLNGKAFNDKLDYVTGLYYFREAGYVHDFVPFAGILYVYDIANDVDTSSYAGFVHGDYKVTDRFGVTLGARYSKETKKFIGGQADLNGFTYKISGCNPPSDPANLHFDPNIPAAVTCQNALGFPVAGQPLRYFPADQQKQDFNVFTPKIGAQFQLTDDVLLYTSWSKGFKSGGWTTRLSNPIQSGTDAEFKPEFDKMTEVGLKSELLDHRMLLNTAVFYSKYTDIQLNFQESASPVLRNGGDATIKGIEVEIQALLGYGFSLNLSGGYMDAKYTRVNPLVGIPLSSKLPKTPKSKYNIGPQYDVKVPTGGTLRFGVDYTHTASLFNDSLNTPELHRPATDNVNASIHYLTQGEKYEWVVGATNLTDDRYLTVGSINLAAGEMVGTYNRPRELYITLKANFGGD
ncbi:MAG: TonB-dependent receptor [Gammaproteobacteria bacterium]